MNHLSRRWISVVAVLLLATDSRASRPPARSEVIGTYFNEERTLIELEIISKDGKEGTVIPISPGRIDRAVITEGQTKLYIPAEQRSQRHLLSIITTPTPTSASEFFDHTRRTFYFRIIGKKIILVKWRDLTSDEQRRLKVALRQFQAQ